MKFILQRVREAKVTVDNIIKGEIGKGYLLFVGVSDTDTEEIADRMIQKVYNLRIFEDENGKTNLNIDQINGEILVVSQFTLYADCKKGNRPSFTKAGNPDIAKKLYRYIIDKCKTLFVNTSEGVFGADMKVSLVNDGPFTVILDSDELF